MVGDKIKRQFYLFVFFIHSPRMAAMATGKNADKYLKQKSVEGIQTFFYSSSNMKLKSKR